MVRAAKAVKTQIPLFKAIRAVNGCKDPLRIVERMLSGAAWRDSSFVGDLVNECVVTMRNAVTSARKEFIGDTITD